MALLQIQYDIPYSLSLPIALASGVVLGVAAELTLRRLFTQPRLLLFVATLGLTQIIQLLQLRTPDSGRARPKRQLSGADRRQLGHRRSQRLRAAADRADRRPDPDGVSRLVVPELEVRHAGSSHGRQPSRRPARRHQRAQRVDEGVGDRRIAGHSQRTVDRPVARRLDRCCVHRTRPEAAAALTDRGDGRADEVVWLDPGRWSRSAASSTGS